AAVAGAARVMNVIAFNERVGGATGAGVAADVHPLALRRARGAQAGVMDMVAPDDEGVAVAAVHGERVVAGFKNLAVLERDVMSANEAHPRAAALEAQPADNQVRTIDKLDVVLA